MARPRVIRVGYWANSADHTAEYPWPVSSPEPQPQRDEFLRKWKALYNAGAHGNAPVTELIRNPGPSPCRLCKQNNGSTEVEWTTTLAGTEERV